MSTSSKRERKNPVRFAKVELALFGVNGRGGIVKDIADIKAALKSVEDWRQQEEEKGRDWRGLALQIIGGAAVALFTLALSTLL